ncbi:hypothetical protein LE190_15730 [Massilia oculi]|uniref:REDY-like protein HapK n=1 Tax=Massilia hydrophila TaxID=3044279 RepID=A0ABS7YGJ1_9BURK|nr:hypothetical protein [Massilia oculi]MCA1857364.1 hypothetical protein [Massilia oculi]
MTTLIVLFNLKPGVSAADYEAWARGTDLPTAGALPSVEKFEVLKSVSVLGSAASAPYQYIERIVVRDMAQLGADIATPAMQQVSAAFQAFADNPVFIVTETL